MISVGQLAPNFTLHTNAKETISLESLKGKNVLLLFFPQAFTGVCTKELCGVRDNIAMYNNSTPPSLPIIYILKSKFNAHI